MLYAEAGVASFRITMTMALGSLTGDWTFAIKCIVGFGIRPHNLPVTPVARVEPSYHGNSRPVD
jgi:hypothetical protein